MALPLPNLDDRSFSQVAEDARALIPSTAPEWTDHNVHDPGITFIELFAWLAEIEHYRLNQTAAPTYLRFFSLVGVTPLAQHPAEVAVAIEVANLPAGVFAPAASRLTAIGHEALTFETLRDTFLTTAQLKRVITIAGGRETVQTSAQESGAGHYQAFGPAPGAGDLLLLGFENWFEQQQGHLTITLFDDDLQRAEPLPPDGSGFVPSARIVWEYWANDWEPLDVIEDNTLSFSRSGDVIFRHPQGAQVQNGYRWLRARLDAGGFEIPPRIFRVETNVIRARQVETIVNEYLGKGLGIADQTVALAKKPLLMTSELDDRLCQAGEVLEWQVLLERLNNAPGTDERSRAIAYVARRLTDLGARLDLVEPQDGADGVALAAFFNQLLDEPELYDARKLGWLAIPEAFQEIENGMPAHWQDRRNIRSFNRYVLQRIFPDQFTSDRIEIETGVITTDDTAKDWVTWDVVESFADSGPNDRHYRVDANSGVVMFGNGLNGRVPQPAELIRARFYRHSQGGAGNLSAGQRWLLAVSPEGTTVRMRGANSKAAAGGSDPQSMDDGKDAARAAFRKQYPMLSAKDYEDRARGTPGLRIARVKAIPNLSPTLCLKWPGEVTVIVVPAPPPVDSFPDAAPPSPTDGFRQTVQTYLDQQRVVTTNIHVIGPVYVPVAVQCRVFLKRRAAVADARRNVDQILKSFLDPVTGGPGPGKGWPFGRSVFPSEIHQQLARLPAVDYVTDVALNTLKAGQALQLPYNGLPRPTGHAVELVPFELRGRLQAKGKDKICD